MYYEVVDFDCCGSGVEGGDVDMIDGVVVDGVVEVGFEFFEFECVDVVCDFFVDGEVDVDFWLW